MKDLNRAALKLKIDIFIAFKGRIEFQIVAIKKKAVSKNAGMKYFGRKRDRFRQLCTVVQLFKA
jgi:hypothetical protein